MNPSEKYQITSHDIELDKLVALRIEALKTNPDSFGEKFEDAATRTLVDWRFWFSQRHNTVNQIFVALKKAQYVGMCGLYFDEKKLLKPYIWGLYIKPSERNMGLGRKLISEIVDSLKATPSTTLTLRVEKENNKALSFYQRVGFSTSNSHSKYTEMRMKIE